MTIEPSCPALVILDDDAFRRSLVATLDLRHFSVTFLADGSAALEVLRERASAFRVIVIGIDVEGGKGLEALRYLEQHRDAVDAAVIIVGEPGPRLRTFASWADEILQRPVDPDYVATRARMYCNG